MLGKDTFFWCVPVPARVSVGTPGCVALRVEALHCVWKRPIACGSVPLRVEASRRVQKKWRSSNPTFDPYVCFFIKMRDIVKLVKGKT